MLQVIDRRLNGRHKSASNRQRFIRRYKQQIRKAVADAITDRSITDTDSGEKISIPARDIKEPTFRHGRGGRNETVHTGNKEFITGDEIKRPDSGGGKGQGSDASNDGEGEDDFIFQLSRDEFMELFFEDLELPNLAKTQITRTVEFDSVRSGHSRDGIPSNIDIVRSLQGAMARRIALQMPLKRELRSAEEELESLSESETPDDERVVILEEQARHFKARIKSIPFVDEFDLRFHNRVQRPKPKTQAVMFCLMDVSGSMDEQRKDIAKRFFILLYYFLNRSYEHIQVVFIRHHTTASEVDEETFFHSRETGGTVVSSALELMNKIIEQRYPLSDWNIYAAQASDGDNWPADSGVCRELLTEQILPKMQYYAYVQIAVERQQQLWQEYDAISAEHPHFAMRTIIERSQIYPVFRQLMQKREA